jgi:hypothetical protein
MSTETKEFDALPIPEFTTFNAVKKALDEAGEKKVMAVVRHSGYQCWVAMSWNTPTREELAFATNLMPSMYKLFMPHVVNMVVYKDGLTDITDKHGDVPCAVFYLEIGNK